MWPPVRCDSGLWRRKAGHLVRWPAEIVQSRGSGLMVLPHSGMRWPVHLPPGWIPDILRSCFLTGAHAEAVPVRSGFGCRRVCLFSAALPPFSWIRLEAHEGRPELWWSRRCVGSPCLAHAIRSLQRSFTCLIPPFFCPARFQPSVETRAWLFCLIRDLPDVIPFKPS